MAGAVYARTPVESRALGPMSEETEAVLEGCSPRSTDSADMQLTPHTRLSSRARRPALVRWVVTQLHRRGDGSSGQQQRSDQQSLVSGSSWDSLTELEQLAGGGCPGREALTLPPPPAPSMLRQRQQQPEQQPEQQHSTAVDAAPAAASAAGGGGRVQRCLRALLRPVLRLVQGAARVLSSTAGPQGPGNNDNTRAERVLNVMTSLPFFAVGLHGLRRRVTGRGRHFSLSFLLVGAAASCYHGAHRASWARLLLRKADYYAICYSSTVMRRAAHIPLPAPLVLASPLVALVKPSALTGINLALVEGKYLRTALQHSHLLPSFKAHLGTALAGLACFACEDVATEAWGWPPVLHSLWHCLSAVAMGCTHALFGHIEQCLEMALLAEGMQVTAAGGL